MDTALAQFLVSTFFLTIVFLHLAKKNMATVTAYALQSLAVAGLLYLQFLESGTGGDLAIAILVLLVKAILAPAFLWRLIRKHALTFSISAYLNVPLTLLCLAALTATAHAEKLSPLTGIVPANSSLLSLALSAMFLSLFLIINRKGSISQMIGVLSLENSIVAFAIFAGLEQSFGLEIGIIFDMFAWIIIATAFTGIIYKHFGSLDTAAMKHLHD